MNIAIAIAIDDGHHPQNMLRVQRVKKRKGWNAESQEKNKQMGEGGGVAPPPPFTVFSVGGAKEGGEKESQWWVSDYFDSFSRRAISCPSPPHDSVDVERKGISPPAPAQTGTVIPSACLNVPVLSFPSLWILCVFYVLVSCACVLC